MQCDKLSLSLASDATIKIMIKQMTFLICHIIDFLVIVIFLIFCHFLAHYEIRHSENERGSPYFKCHVSNVSNNVNVSKFQISLSREKDSLKCSQNWRCERPASFFSNKINHIDVIMIYTFVWSDEDYDDGKSYILAALNSLFCQNMLRII